MSGKLKAIVLTLAVTAIGAPAAQADSYRNPSDSYRAQPRDAYRNPASDVQGTKWTSRPHSNTWSRAAN